MKALTIPTDSPPVATELEHSLEAFQDAVGGLFEAVAVGTGHTLICNEGGKLDGLPVNETATDVFSSHLLPGDDLRGTVLLLGGPDPEGNFVDIDPRLWALGELTPTIPVEALRRTLNRVLTDTDPIGDRDE